LAPKKGMKQYYKCQKCGEFEPYYGDFKCTKKLKKCMVCEEMKKHVIQTGFMFKCCQDCAEKELGRCKKCGKETKIKDFTNFGSYKEFTIRNLCQKCQNY
jgi:hypothetical protein